MVSLASACKERALEPSHIKEIGRYSMKSLRVMGAQFDAKNIEHSVLCLGSPRSSGGTCTTAFLISRDGFALTNRHAIAEIDAHIEIAHPTLPMKAQRLYFDSRMRKEDAMQFTVVKSPAQVHDPKLNAEFYAKHLDDPQLCSNDYDFALIKIVDEAIIRRLKLQFIRLSAADPSPNERLFSAGFSGRKYDHESFAQLQKQRQIYGTSTPAFGSQDGRFAYSTGIFKTKIRRQLVTMATAQQIANNEGPHYDSDSLDTMRGASGSPVINGNGDVVGILWAGNSGLVGKENRKQTIACAISVQHIKATLGLASFIDSSRQP